MTQIVTESELLCERSHVEEISQILKATKSEIKIMAGILFSAIKQRRRKKKPAADVCEH